LDAFPYETYTQDYTSDRPFRRLVEEVLNRQSAGNPAIHPVLCTHAPWKHQLDAFRFAYFKTGCFLALDMGTGKTKVAIDLVVSSGHKRTLIVCPKSVVPVWPAQFAQHTRYVLPILAHDRHSKVSTAQKQRDIAAFVHAHDMAVVVVNYDILARMEATLQDCHFDCIIADESHRIKDAHGKASMALARLGCGAKWRLCLSGTPAPHSPLDFFAQLRFLDPGILGLSYKKFLDTYTVPADRVGGKVVMQNEEKLREKLKPVLMQVKKRDVLDLPPCVLDYRYGDFPDAKPYRDMHRDFVAEIAGGTVTAANGAVKVLRLMQLTSGFGKVGEENIPWDSTKRDLLLDYLEDVPREEAVVVFCHFQHDLDVAKECLRESGRQVLELSGRRHDIDSTLPEGYSLVCNPKSGGLGIDLTRACYGVFYSVSYDAGDYYQACARLDRPGQTRPVTLTHLLVNNTVDRLVYKSLKDKQDVVQTILQDLDNLCD
jgi:SNF2 family DNA or RNA helicase